MPRIRNLGDKRRRALAARTKDAFFVEHFREAITKISESKFCLGDNDRGWKADFDFLLKPGVIEKVIEGKYDNRAAAQPGPARSPLSEGPGMTITKSREDIIAANPLLEYCASKQAGN